MKLFQTGLLIMSARVVYVGPAAGQPEHGREEWSRGDHPGSALRQTAQSGTYTSISSRVILRAIRWQVQYQVRFQVMSQVIYLTRAVFRTGSMLDIRSGIRSGIR